MAVASPVQARHGGFARHFLGMAGAMLVGMTAGAAVFFGATGSAAADAMRRHAVLFVVVQGLGMTLAMVAWMRRSGHGWRACSEMGAAMVVPALPLVGLRIAGVIGGPICGAYCALTFGAMLLLVLYRRGEYGARR